MKCDPCRSYLLNAEDPSHPIEPFQAHLEECAACREWQVRLLQIGVNVRRLPVPSSTAKPELIRQILHPPLPARPSPPQARSWKWRWLAGGAVAAAVLISCGAWLGNLLWNSVLGPAEGPQVQVRDNQGGQPPPQGGRPSRKEKPVPAIATGAKASDLLIARLIQCDLRLARANSPRKRALAVADLASHLERELQDLARIAGARPLEKMARVYDKVVREGVVPRCRAVPAGQRRQVLAPIIDRLAQAERNAQRLARQRPSAAPVLRSIAAAAGEGKKQLRDLLQQEA